MADIKPLSLATVRTGTTSGPLAGVQAAFRMRWTIASWTENARVDKSTTVPNVWKDWAAFVMPTHFAGVNQPAVPLEHVNEDQGGARCLAGRGMPKIKLSR